MGAPCVNTCLQLVPVALYIWTSFQGGPWGDWALARLHFKKVLSGKRLSVIERLKIKIFWKGPGDSICKRTRHPAKGHSLASWHAGCHGCYRKQEQRWPGRSLRSNCGGGVAATRQMGLSGDFKLATVCTLTQKWICLRNLWQLAESFVEHVKLDVSLWQRIKNLPALSVTPDQKESHKLLQM